MSSVTYDRGSVTITLEGLDTVNEALGELAKKTPAAAKVAINATAREARKRMIAQAKARYAVNAAGQKHLKDLVQRKKATNRNLLAELYIAKMRNDLGYFETNPPVPTHFTGTNWRQGPSVWSGKVLKDGNLKPLPGTTGRSKAFLAKFTNTDSEGNKTEHIGMVQRVIGSSSEFTETKSGKPRWKNRQGKVEKLMTLGSPSAAAMHRVVWSYVLPEVEMYLLYRLDSQVEKIIARAKATTGG